VLTDPKQVKMFIGQDSARKSHWWSPGVVNVREFLFQEEEKRSVGNAST
jgi:hypothetical protein